MSLACNNCILIKTIAWRKVTITVDRRDGTATAGTETGLTAAILQRLPRQLQKRTHLEIAATFLPPVHVISISGVLLLFTAVSLQRA
ncbi:hypothetical protein ANANG_G00095760, partial [Anguilla anguilla]